MSERPRFSHLRNDDRRKRFDLKLSNNQDEITTSVVSTPEGRSGSVAPGGRDLRSLGAPPNQSHVKTPYFYPAALRRRHFSQSAAAHSCATQFARCTRGKGGRGERAFFRPGARSHRRQSDQAGNHRRDAATRRSCEIHRTSEVLGRPQGARDFRVPPFHAREGEGCGGGFRLSRTSFSPCERGGGGQGICQGAAPLGARRLKRTCP